jgi:hypothetical protein
VEAGGLDATADCTSADAEPAELPDGDDAVLASGELGQSTLALWPTRWLTLSASMALEVIHRGHGQVALEIRADGTTNVTKA